MAVIKCKMCGGDIELAPDKTFGTCEYCGSTMTLPKIDDEQRAAAFNRGNHFRRIGEFDKALAIYENIVREDENDAEAHWCCALCRFGIEYVEDPATYEWLPTCHRLSFDSFLEDVDYLAALEHSDGITRRQYQKDAAKIAEVQRGILATSQNTEPYDVFICYKETDDKGQRTRDSILAQDIYYQLTEQGRRVFFARITLEDVAGTQYEPYIFAALNSAKVMLVIGTSSENLNAVWVKNEWSRYLALMKKDRSKLLLPCYRDMDPYDLPEQLSILQSYDMGKIGFIQDLLRGVSKVLDSGKKAAPKETTVVQQQGGTNVDALLQRGKMALEDGDWDKADGFYEEVLNHSAQNARAYIGKALVEEKQTSLENLVQTRIAQLDDAEYETFYLQKDEAHIDEMTGLVVPGYFKEDDIRKAYEGHDLSYTSQVRSREQQRVQEMNWWRGNKLLNRAATFATGTEKAELSTALQTLQAELDRRIEDAREQESAAKTAAEESYRSFVLSADDRVRQRAGEAQKKCEERYQEYLKILQTSSDREELSKAQSFFKWLNWYKDSNALVEQCREKINALNAAEQKQNAEAKKRRTKHIMLVAIIAIVAVILGYITSKFINVSSKYKKAKELLAAENYDEAESIFNQLGDYKDSEELLMDIKSVKYDQAEDLLLQGKTKEAAIAFGRASGYKDASERSSDLWADSVVPLAATQYFSFGLRTNGTVVYAGAEKNICSLREVSKWTNIVALSAGDDHVVGLRSDGTVVAAGDNTSKQCNVSDWSDIIAIAAGGDHTVGLKSDGTVVAVGSNKDGKCGVSNWSNIVAIAAGGRHTVGLKSDGTVVAVGYNEDGRCNLFGWRNIVAIAAGGGNTVGLKSNGTVAALGYNEDGQCKVSDWKGIVAIAAGTHHTIGLQSDGKAVAVGFNEYGQCNVSDWTGIVAIAGGKWFHTLGLKSDGTVVAAGDNEFGQCNVTEWMGIWIPKKS